ncbi:oxidoreductase [Rhexocercosporidium sp. MPI-PUGE-AT-0058]|nr:oxidoreductase [Rhexocercosporidium sp. MPI-PUGE-AT-0058]
MAPSPIRVGLIGLAGTPADQYEGTNWAASAHLPYLIKSPHYEIVALLNSSVESARASIVKHGLPETVKAYGTPEDLAADPDVDMVVCSTRVDRHFTPVRPSILAGKTIFVEWPLEKDLSTAREMARLASQHGRKTIVGLQGSFAEPTRVVKALVDGGRIGRVLGSTMFAALGNSGRTESRNVRYFLERGVGGNTLSIHFWHAMECVVSVIGEFKTWNSFLMNQHPTKDIVESNNSISKDTSTVVQPSVPNSVPDQHLFQGITTSNVPFSMHRRGGAPFPGTPAVEWRIQGEKGEIRLTSSDYFIHMGHPEPSTKIELFVEGEGVSEVHWVDGEIDGKRDEVSEMELPVIARGIARLYEASRKGEWVPDWEWAVRRHEVVGEMWTRYDEDVQRGLAI